VSPLFSGQFHTLSFYNGLSVRIIPRAVGIHILYPYIDAADTEKVAGGILMRAGQHSLMHGYDFFEKYPYLAADIRKTKVSCRYRTAMPMQVVVKIYALFRK
jgi:hypothetical protein